MTKTARIILLGLTVNFLETKEGKESLGQQFSLKVKVAFITMILRRVTVRYVGA